jgi:hypothetical protein
MMITTLKISFPYIDLLDTTLLNICEAKKIGSAINIAFKNDMINPKTILVLYGDTQFKILNVILNMFNLLYSST